MTTMLLRQKRVLTQEMDDKLQVPHLSRFEKIEKFLDAMKRRPPDAFLKFCEVMDETKQQGVLDALNLREGVYTKMAQSADETPQEKEQESDDRLPLWDRRHSTGRCYLVKNPDMTKKLQDALPTLRRIIRMDDLWVYLVKHGVVDDLQMENFQAEFKSRGKQVEAIVNYLKAEQLWKTHAFFYSLAQDGQGGAIEEVLGEGEQKVYYI